MTTMSKLAPRLWQAHQERKEEIRKLDERRSKLHTDRLRLERLEAHRELQLVRAYKRNSSRYIAERQSKLGETQRDLNRVRDAIHKLG